MLPPLYWADEVGGELSLAVQQYVENPNRLTLKDVALIRAYLRQWIGSGVWDRNPNHTAESLLKLRSLRAGVDVIRCQADIGSWLRRAVDLGLDPL